MKLDKMVRILGEPWRVKICSCEVEPRLNNLSGFCDHTSHFIGIMDPDEKKGNIDDNVEFINEVIRHEIIHAFLYASGLGDSWEHKDFGHDETVIDWFALQFKKIEVVINQLETAIRVGDEQ